MKRSILLLCLISAALGAWTAIAISRNLNVREVAAQETDRPAARFVPGRRSGVRAGPDLRSAAPRADLDDDDLTPEERINVSVYDAVNRSVVNINTKSTKVDAFFLFDLSSEGAGSGTVIDHQGHILTNYHVIEGAEQIQVTLFDGKNYDAKVVGGDESTDVAVLRVSAPAESLFPVEFGDSTRLRVGQRVYAIGNPFGLERTLTTGIVSSLNRSLPSRNGRTIKSIIQIDAAINPGNSGGPLLNTRGRYIGMNTAIASKTGQNTGVGFAIPVNTIVRVVPQLIAAGKVIRPDVGIGRVYETERGLLIATLVPGGAAEKAGLQGPRVERRRRRQGPFSYEYQTVDRSAADLIVAVDGARITSADEFLSAIESKRPGDEVIVTVIRAGQEVQVPVKLASGG